MTDNNSPTEEVLAATDESQIETVQDSATEETVLETTTNTTAEDSDSEDAEHEDKPKKGFQRRIEKAKATARAEAQAEIEYWKRAAIQNGVKPPETQNVQQVSYEKPTFAQYNNVEEFAEAMADWKIEQKLAQREIKQTQTTVANTYGQRVQEFMKTTPDFHDVLNDANDVPMSPEIGEVCLESELGPQLAYFLANNVDEVERINGLPASKRYVELGKLEAKLASTGVETKKIAVSKAPAPITPVSGAKKGVTATSNLYESASSMNYKDFAKARLEQLQLKAKKK